MTVHIAGIGSITVADMKSALNLIRGYMSMIDPPLSEVIRVEGGNGSPLKGII